MYFCTPKVKVFKENVMCMAADFEILQHLQFPLQELKKQPFYIQLYYEKTTAVLQPLTPSKK